MVEFLILSLKLIGTTYAGTFKSTSIGLQWIYPLKTYTSAFKNTGISTSYVSAFKSVGIAPEIRRYKFSKLLVNTIPAQIKTLEQGLKSTETYSGAFEKRWYKSGDPYCYCPVV